MQIQTLDKNKLYTQLGNLLEYPWEDIRPKVHAVIDLLNGNAYYPSEVMENLKAFHKNIENLTLDNLQGIYSYTFEMSTDYTLDMGYHIHDGFKRTENLVQLKTMYRHFGFPFEDIDKGELPDHLPLALKFIGFLQDEEAKRDFIINFLIKAFEKLNKNFEKSKENPYKPLVNAIFKMIDKDIKEEVK